MIIRFTRSWVLAVFLFTFTQVCTALADNDNSLIRNLLVNQKFNPFYNYSPLGKLPKEFSEIEVFGVWVYGNHGLISDKLKMESEGLTVGAGLTTYPISPQTITLNIQTLNAKQLNFFSEPQDGVSYGFIGAFQSKGDLHRFLDKKVSVLSGILSKFTGGKKIAEAKIDFGCVTVKE